MAKNIFLRLVWQFIAWCSSVIGFHFQVERRQPPPRIRRLLFEGLDPRWTLTGGMCPPVAIDAWASVHHGSTLSSYVSGYELDGVR